jgi:hypothetical protein
MTRISTDQWSCALPVSGSEVGVITTGGHKILPYDVVVIGAGVKAFRRGLLPAVCRLLYSFTW